MRVFAGADEIREAVREIVVLLAARDSEAILGFLDPGLDRARVADEIVEGVWTHGTFDRTSPEETLGYRVVPLRDEYRETFERFLTVDLEGAYGLDRHRYARMAFAFLPLDREYGGEVSDLRIELPSGAFLWVSPWRAWPSGPPDGLPSSLFSFAT